MPMQKTVMNIEATLRISYGIVNRETYLIIGNIMTLKSMSQLLMII